MWRRVENLKQGRDGERAVGQYLERLREDGAQVFHDIPAKGFNVDHVVISPHGIYVIETKTLSKPVQGKPTAWVRDGKLVVGGRVPERDPIEQARAVADWTQTLLRDSTGRTFPVRPVVVLPGWFVERVDTNATNGVWVLNPKALPAFIANEPSALRTEDVKLAAYHLSRYVRTTP